MSLIRLKYSDTPGKIPPFLEVGELASNIADGNLFYGTKTGVKQFAFGSGSASGSLVTASIVGGNNASNQILFTKGNGTTFTLTVNTGSGGGGGGTVTSIATAGLISGGTITTTGTISTSMNTNRLVGRSTSGVGIMEEIIVGTGLNLSAGTLSATGGGGTFPFNGSAVITGSLLVSGSGITVTGSLNVSNGITGSLQGTSSWAQSASNAINAQTSSNIRGGTQNYIPLWKTDTSLTSSYLYQEYSILKTIYNSIDKGLILDYSENAGVLGTSTSVGDGYTKGIGVYFGSTKPIVYIGDRDIDTPGNLTYLEVNDFNSRIKTYYSSLGGVGLNLDFGNNVFTFGDYDDVGNKLKIKITDGNGIQITGSLNSSGSVFFPSLVPSSSVTNVVTINPSTGQLYYTASSAIGGGTGATFPFNGPAVITGSLLVSGSGITVTGSLNAANITGSLFGTASWAQNALTASYVTGSIFTSTNPALSASYALTASHALNAGGTPGGSNTQVQFNANNTFSGSRNFTFNSGSNILTLTGSLTLISGSNSDKLIMIKNTGTPSVFTQMSPSGFIMNSDGYSTELFGPQSPSSNGTVRIPNGGFDTALALSVNGEYADVNGAITLSTVPTASFVTASNVYGPHGSNSILSSSYALTASYALNAAVSAFPFSGSAVITGSLLVSGSGIIVTGSLNAANITGSLFGTASWAQSASNAINAITSSYPISVTGSGTTLYSVSPLATPNFGAGSTHSIFFGQQAGYLASDAYYANFLGRLAGYQAYFAEDSNFLGYRAGFFGTYANRSNFLGSEAGSNASYASQSNFLGYQAGYDAIYAYNSNFLGYQVGYQAAYANDSTFIGYRAGYLAYSASNSTFIGNSAGIQAYFASSSIFIGSGSGDTAINANNSIFIGSTAGKNASSTHSIYIGTNAGNSTDGGNSVIIGRDAGSAISSTSNSVLIGYQAGKRITSTGIGNNNIIIGTNITLANSTVNSINIGGILFGTGSYSDTTTNPFSGSAGGRIGINVVSPIYTLDVSGSGNFNNNLTVTGSFVQGLNSTANNTYAHAQGRLTTASANYSHAEGYLTKATGDYSHAEGYFTFTNNSYAHAEGLNTSASGEAAHAEGYFTKALAFYSHAEGRSTTVQSTGQYSHTEGRSTSVTGEAAHAEGLNTSAAGWYSHVEGEQTTTIGQASHAEGNNTIAFADYSHAEGIGTIASGSGQLAIGQYNRRGNTTSLFVIGNGTGDLDANRSDVVRVETSGVQITGSLNVAPSNALEFQVASTGVTVGNVITDTHRVTGSLNVSGSTIIRGNTTITGSLNVSGSTTIRGNTTISGSLNVSGSIIPNVGVGTTSSFTLGNAQAAWKALFVATRSIHFVDVDGTEVGNISVERRNGTTPFINTGDIISYNRAEDIYSGIVAEANTGLVQLGDYNKVLASPISLTIEPGAAQAMYTEGSSSGQSGLKIDFQNDPFPRVYLGDFNGTGKSTSLIISDPIQTITTSGSFIMSGSLNVTRGITGSLQGTSSYALTASYVLNGGTSTTPTQIATGSVTASVTPTQFSITSGSVTEFSVVGTGVTIGNIITDTHRITGSLNITGSSTLVGNQIITGSFTVITGSSIELQVTDTGVKIGNTISDVHTITGSLRVSGSVVDFYPSYSFRVNNTNTSASTTTTTYRDAGIQTYAGTASWTGTTPPGNPTTHSYAWNQVGSLVTLRMNLIYGSAGSALTAVSMTLPTDCPTPASPTGLTAASDVLSYGSGILSTTRTIISVVSIGAGTAALRRNSANNGYEIVVIRNSAGYQYAYATIQYFV